MSTWFTALTGFPERAWAETQAEFEVDGPTLRSRVNGRAFHIGTLTMPSVAELRTEVQQAAGALRGRPRVSRVTADVTDLHRAPENRGATFQVASQFNLLEMTGPDVTPEDGVTRYAFDRTQGPACAIAAGAATLYRNYCLPLGDQRGQTSTRQVDCLHDIGLALGNEHGALWRMRNGYALATEAGLTEASARLADMTPAAVDALRDRLRVGVHHDVQVTLHDVPPEQRVTQVFCSALPVAYTRVPAHVWQPLACLVLEGAYEATLLAAVLNAARGASPVAYLTRLGGGAFGNPHEWIGAAMERALDAVQGYALEVRVVERAR